MPFLALAGPIAGALGASAATAGVIGAAGTVAGTMIQNNQAKKAAGSGAPQVNVDTLQQQARDIATSNANYAAELEKQLTPEVPQLRTQANQAVLNGLQQPGYLTAAQEFLSKRLENQGRQPTLLDQAVARASGDLSLGGALPMDVQNLVARQAAARAGSTAQNAGLGLGRDINARDLGLASLQLQQQRLTNAANLGQAQLQQTGQNDSTNLNIVGLLQQIQQARAQQNQAAAIYGQSIQQPMVGMDPGSVANVSVANMNAQNAYQANMANLQGKQGTDMMGLAGNLLGSYLSNGSFGGAATKAPAPTSFNYTPSTTGVSLANTNPAFYQFGKVNFGQ